MKKSGASLLVYALEQIGVSKTFGIPGVHNTEIYSQLSNSRFIEPIIVTHELSGGYMADAVSRTTDTIGTMVIIPGAGLTHAMSAIAGAYIDGISMLVISGGINHNAGKSFQMHQLDMERVVGGIVKRYYLLREPAKVISTVYEAYNLAISGEPGPVFIEIPLETQLMQESVIEKPYKKLSVEGPFDKEETESPNGLILVAKRSDNLANLNKAVDMLSGAVNPGIYVGWGAKNAVTEIEKLAELLVAPVCTTIQGVSVFSADKPFHTGVGFGANASLAAQNAFKNCDCLLAVGVKFSELATGNYQLDVPDSLIHVDINSSVFNKNYPAKATLEGDAKLILNKILEKLQVIELAPAKKVNELKTQIKRDKEGYKKTWFKKPGESMVTPGFFYNALRNNLPDDVIIVADDGNHMLLTAELFPVHDKGFFICPTDYSAMGYGIPAAIGAKLLDRQKTVVTITGDGGLLMCGNELITAYRNKVGLIVFVFRDVKSRQIVEEQKFTIGATSQLIEAVDLEGFAKGVKAVYMSIKSDIDISGVLTKAKEKVNEKRTVIIEVNIDYSRKSSFAAGLIKPKSGRISFTDKIKMLFKKGKLWF